MSQVLIGFPIISTVIIGAIRLVLNPFNLSIMLVLIYHNMNKNKVKFVKGILNIAVFQFFFNASIMLKIYLMRNDPSTIFQTIIFIFISFLILLYCFRLLTNIKWIEFIIIPKINFNSLKDILLLTILFIVSIIPMRFDMANAFVSLNVSLIQRNLIFLLFSFLLLPLIYYLIWNLLKCILIFIRRIIKKSNKTDLLQKIVACVAILIVIFIISAKIIGFEINWW